MLKRSSLIGLLALFLALMPVMEPARAAIRTVTTTADSGAGSLRQAISDAASGDTITFDIPPSQAVGGVWTIQPTTPLPPISQGGITIDAGADHTIVLDGSDILTDSHGLRITSPNNTIRGLVIGNFPLVVTLDLAIGGSGIYIGGANASGNRVLGCYLGVAPDGVNAAGNDSFGVLIDNGARDNFVGGSVPGEGNVIAGNGRGNVTIGQFSSGSSTISGNQIIGNVIGANAAGTAEIGGGNPGNGVLLGDYAQANIVGPGNLISGHNASSISVGVAVSAQVPSRARPDNEIIGNRIGTQANGVDPIPNSIGVKIFTAVDTIVGASDSGNIIARNADDGVVVELDASGTVVAGNLIAANGSDGLLIKNATTVRDNRISTNAGGTAADATTINLGMSVRIERGAGSVIGGPSEADRNIIAIGGGGSGILMTPAPGASVTGTIVQNNYIGLSQTGTDPLRTSTSDADSYGVQINASAGNSVLDNVISGNSGYGVGLLNAGTSGNLIRGNLIGTNASGDISVRQATLGNRRDGILILNGPTNNTIEGNLIANNGRGPTRLFQAIHVKGSTTTDNVIQDNLLTQNFGSGIWIEAATRIKISRTETRANDGDGIFLSSGGNGGLAAPTLALSGTTLSGTTCPNCIVEVFTNATREDGEGPHFLTQGSADAGGSFSIDVNGCESFLTATARVPESDATSGDNTSPFALMIGGCVSAPPNFQLTPGTPASSSGAPHLLAPGGQVVYQHTLTNLDGITRTFQIERTSSQGWASPPGLLSVMLGPGASATVRVTVTVPLDAVAGMVEQTAVTASVGGETRSQTNYTGVEQPGGPIPQIAPAARTRLTLPVASVIFTHTVTNAGDTSGNFSVSVTNTPPSGWNFALSSPTSFALAPGASRVITLTVTLPTPAPDADTEVTAQLRVDAVGDGFATASDTVQVLLQPAFSFSEASSPTTTGLPGRTVVFTHTLTNLGNGADTFTIAITPTGGLTADPVAPIALERDASAQVAVRVHIPDGALAGSYTVDVTAQSSSSPRPPAITRTDTVIVEGAAVPALSEAPPRGVAAPGVVTFTHTLTNTGNQTGTFTLSASAPVGWDATVDTPACDLAPGATCAFTVTVTVPAEAEAGPNPVVVTATTVGSDASASVTDIVNVDALPGLELAPDGPTEQLAGPGELVTYTLVLTNTGNGADTFALGLDVSPGWSATITPTSPVSLTRGASQQLTVQVTAPTGVPAGSSGVVTVTATSALDGLVSASVTLTTTIEGVVAAELIPAAQSRRADPTADLADTAIFTHTLRNSGSLSATYEITASSSPLDWETTITPTLVGPLAPGETAIVTVSVTVPAGTEPGAQTVTRVQVREQGGTNDLATAEDTTVVGPQFGALLTPAENSSAALPGDTAVYTHTLTNIGSADDIFVLSTIASNGWPTTVTPSSVDLAVGASATVSVAVQVPTSALSGTVDIATLVAQSTSDPTTSVRSQERTTVLQVAGVSLSPRRFRVVEPGDTLTLLHTLVNTGNGLDTFILTATGTLDWPITITPLTKTLGPGDAFPSIVVRVQVPAELERGTTNQITITATSSSDPTVMRQIEDIAIYPEAEQAPPLSWKLYLPGIMQ